MIAHKMLPLDQVFVADFCRRHQIRKLSLFGSALTDRFNDASDLDLLVEFEEGARVSLFDVGGMMHELTEKLGRQVDIRTPDDLGHHIRDRVMSGAEVIYAAE